IVACLVVLAKFAALGTLPAAVHAPALLAAPLLGRWAIVVAYWAYPYARRTPGASLALKAQATAPRAAAATLFALVVLVLTLGPPFSPRGKGVGRIGVALELLRSAAVLDAPAHAAGAAGGGAGAGSRARLVPGRGTAARGAPRRGRHPAESLSPTRAGGRAAA